MGNVYAFQNLNATIAGPGGFAQLASGAGAAEEGITIAAMEDKNMMQIGADGKGQHSLIANDACIITVRLLKTSPQNGILMAMYDLQTSSSALHGINTITVNDSGRGDTTIIQQVAFKKKPDLNYAKEAGTMEWVFDGIKANTFLGV